MVDIETMSHGSNSAIIEIGAVSFNINTGQIIDRFHRSIDLQSCIDAGLKVRGDAIIWWMQQDQESRDKICKADNVSIATALYDFQQWLEPGYNNDCIWGRSPRFDLGIIFDAYRTVLGYNDPPWNIRKERDVRTYAALRPEVLDQIPPNTSKHDAIADCEYQISYITKIHNLLKP